MELGRHNEMETKNAVEVNASVLQDKIGKECQYVYYQKVFCNGWYTAHDIMLLSLVKFSNRGKITKNIRYNTQNQHSAVVFSRFSSFFFIFCLFYEMILLYLPKIRLKDIYFYYF